MFLFKLLKKLLWTIGTLLVLLLLVWGGLNLAKFFIYKDYYNAETAVCKNPGLSDGFVCQGIATVEEQGLILVSGYMTGSDPSRIYLTNTSSNASYVTLSFEGAPYDGHAGGIAVSGNMVYVAGDRSVFTLPLDTLLSAQNGSEVSFTQRIPVNNSASFCFATEDFLYVGEFHDGGKYVTEHPHTAPEGENHAIVSMYSLDDLTQPVRIYSIRDKVQGFAVKNGKILMSTSYGLSDSIYYLYDTESAVASGKMLDGAEIYHFGAPEKIVKGPAMAEGLALWNDTFITLTESASDKYIFGKFFFANDIVSLEL